MFRGRRRSELISYNWDGETHNDAYNSLNLPLPFPDALQEFKVESSALGAQYGQHASANVNAVTKSGTNALHGDAFEFLRNNALNSRDFFAPTRDTLKRNQFGGTIGGPIRKDKLFVFGGYQQTILHTTPAFNIGYIPTAAIINGDFTDFASAACNGGKQFNLSAAQGFSGNRISPGAARIRGFENSIDTSFGDSRCVRKGDLRDSRRPDREYGRRPVGLAKER